MRGKLNNKGFTLVELLIAVTVLAIGAVPILANFVQSGTMNMKAKRNLNATSMAQDIMEGMSAYSADEVINMFESESDLMGRILPNNVTSYDSHGDADASWTVKYEAIKGSFNTADAAVGARQYSEEVVSGNSTKVKKTVSGNDYHFFVKNIKQGKNEYNLRVTLSTEKMVDSTDSLVTKTNSVNRTEIANIAKIEKPSDVVLKISEADYVSAISKLRGNADITKASRFDTEEAITHLPACLQNIRRDIYIDITDTPVSGASNYSVGYRVNYTVNSAQRDYFGVNNCESSCPGPTTTTTGHLHKWEVQTIAKNNVSTLPGTQLPRAIYLYYEGMPFSTSGGTTFNSGCLDNFHINNTTGKEIDIYIIRTIQAPSDVANIESETNASYNANYRGSIEVVSKSPTAVAGSYTNDTLTEVISNMRDNLNKAYAGRSTAFDASRGAYTYNTVAVGATSLKTDPLSTGEKVFFDGYQKIAKDHVYTVQLEVRDAKRNNKVVAKFDGGLAE